MSATVFTAAADAHTNIGGKRPLPSALRRVSPPPDFVLSRSDAALSTLTSSSVAPPATTTCTSLLVPPSMNDTSGRPPNFDVRSLLDWCARSLDDAEPQATETATELRSRIADLRARLATMEHKVETSPPLQPLCVVIRGTGRAHSSTPCVVHSFQQPAEPAQARWYQ